MEKIKEKIQKFRFRLLLLPVDNHSDVPVTVIGFRKGVLYFSVLLMASLLISFLVFRFTPANALVDVKAELSDEEKATIIDLNKRVTLLGTELNKIKKENDRMKFLLTVTDTSATKKKDTVAMKEAVKKSGKKKQVKK